MDRLNPIRVGVRAVIPRDFDQLPDTDILMVKFDDDSGPHYNYPGGGVQAGETLHQALLREIGEETQARVSVAQMLLAYEYVSPGGECGESATQKLDMVFLCCLKDASPIGMPDWPDPFQVGVEWLPLASLENFLIYPPIAGRVRDRLKVSAVSDPYVGNCYHFPLFT